MKSIIHFDCNKKDSFYISDNKLISYSDNKEDSTRTLINKNGVYENNKFKCTNGGLYQVSPVKGSNNFTFFYMGSYSNDTPQNSVLAGQTWAEVINGCWRLRRSGDSNALELYLGDPYREEYGRDKVIIPCDPDEKFIICGYHDREERGLIIKTSKGINKISNKNSIQRLSLDYARAYVTIGCDLYENSHLNPGFREEYNANCVCNEFILYYETLSEEDILYKLEELEAKWVIEDKLTDEYLLELLKNSVNKGEEQINYLDSVIEQLHKWKNQNIDIRDCISYITAQKDTIFNELHKVLREFKLGLMDLQEIANNITNSEGNIIFDDEEYENVELYQKIILLENYYKDLVNDIKMDKESLIEAENNIKNIMNIGIDCGNALETINKQIDNLSNIISQYNARLSYYCNNTKKISDNINLD